MCRRGHRAEGSAEARSKRLRSTVLCFEGLLCFLASEFASGLGFRPVPRDAELAHAAERAQREFTDSP